MVNKLILGTAQIGLDYGINNINGKITKERAFEIFNYAYQSGIQYLDTAPVYGDAQKIIGEFHKLNPTKIFKIITKIPSEYPIEHLEELVDSFLIEMNINRIDILHFHSIKDYVKAEPVMLNEMLLRLKYNQKVLSFGVSIYENSEVELISGMLIDVIQLPFNLLDNENLRGELIHSLKQNDFKVHTRSVFLQGLFFAPSYKIIDVELKSALVSLKEICHKNNFEIDELAINYCISQKSIDNILIGVDNIDQLRKNISITFKHHQIDCFEQVNKIRISNTDKLNPSKWQIE